MKLMRVNKAVTVVISKGIGFLRRQQRDWKITVARTSLRTFVYKMVFPYQSIYIVALGATAPNWALLTLLGWA